MVSYSLANVNQSCNHTRPNVRTISEAQMSGCLWIKLTQLIHHSLYHLHLCTLITFTDFFTFLMFAAAFPDSQDSTDRIWGLWWIGCSRGNRWCWWCCRGQRSAWGKIKERQTDLDRVRRDRITYQLHRSQTALCFWWSCKDIDTSTQPSS